MKQRKVKVTTQTAATHDSTALAPSDTIISEKCMINKQKRAIGGERREERESERERTCFHI